MKKRTVGATVGSPPHDAELYSVRSMGMPCSFAIMIPSSFHDKNDPTARPRIKFSGVRDNVIINVFKEMILTIGVGYVI